MTSGVIAKAIRAIRVAVPVPLLVAGDSWVIGPTKPTDASDTARPGMKYLQHEIMDKLGIHMKARIGHVATTQKGLS